MACPLANAVLNGMFEVARVARGHADFYGPATPNPFLFPHPSPPEDLRQEVETMLSNITKARASALVQGCSRVVAAVES